MTIRIKIKHERQSPDVSLHKAYIKAFINHLIWMPDPKKCIAYLLAIKILFFLYTLR